MEWNYSTLSYLRNVWEGLKPVLSFSAKTVQEWQKWRDELREKLNELLGGFPEEKCSLNAGIIEEVKMNGYVRQKVVFDTEPGVSVPAYVLIPEGNVEKKGKMRALLCLHGHGRGKDDVCGIVKDDVERQKFIRPSNYDYAVQFVKRGYLVLAPDARCFGERGADGMTCTWAFTSGLLMGKILVGMRVWDAIRAIDYLQARPEVDRDRIGCVGLSWGGTHTIYTSALDERIKVAVVSGYFGDFRDVLIERDCCPCQYIPNILKYADLPDIVSLIAPRPLLIENGKWDPLYTLEIVQREYRKVEKVYQLLGVPEKLDIDLFDGAHTFSGKKAFNWTDKWL